MGKEQKICYMNFDERTEHHELNWEMEGASEEMMFWEGASEPGGAMQMYFRDVGRIPLLSPEEERLLDYCG